MGDPTCPHCGAGQVVVDPQAETIVGIEDEAPQRGAASAGWDSEETVTDPVEDEAPQKDSGSARVGTGGKFGRRTPSSMNKTLVFEDADALRAQALAHRPTKVIDEEGKATDAAKSGDPIDSPEQDLANLQPTRAVLKWLLFVSFISVVGLPIFFWLLWGGVGRQYRVTTHAWSVQPLWGSRLRTLEHRHLAQCEINSALMGLSATLCLMPLDRSNQRPIYFRYCRPEELQDLLAKVEAWRASLS